MSMTIETKIKGLTELDLLLEALRAMGKNVYSVKGNQKIRGKSVVAAFHAGVHKVGISMDSKNNLVMVGDQDWDIMNNLDFKEELLQQYGVASIRKKAEELRYTIASQETLENGSIRIVARAWG